MTEEKSTLPVRFFIRPEGKWEEESEPHSQALEEAKVNLVRDLTHLLMTLWVSFVEVARTEFHTTHKLRSLLHEDWKSRDKKQHFDLRVLTEDNNIALLVSKHWGKPRRRGELGFILGSEEPVDVLMRQLGGSWDVVEVKPSPKVLISSSAFSTGILRDLAKTIHVQFADPSFAHVRRLFLDVEREVIVPEASLEETSAWLKAAARRIKREAEEFEAKGKAHEEEFYRRMLGMTHKSREAPA